jgi:hypothetical protein
MNRYDPDTIDLETLAPDWLAAWSAGNNVAGIE